MLSASTRAGPTTHHDDCYATMDMRSYEAGQVQKSKTKRDNESGGNHKESTGKKVEVVWACDEKRGTLRRREGDGNESTGVKEERKT